MFGVFGADVISQPDGYAEGSEVEGLVGKDVSMICRMTINGNYCDVKAVDW